MSKSNNKYIVSIAKNIQEADRLLNLFVFDLLILDVMLPDSSGLDFYKNSIKNTFSILINTSNNKYN